MKKRSKSSQIFARETRLRASSRPFMISSRWSISKEAKERKLDKKEGIEKRKKEKKKMTDRIEIKTSPGEVFDHPVGVEQWRGELLSWRWRHRFREV